MHLVHEGDDVPLSDPLAEPFVPSPRKDGGVPMLQGNRGIKNIPIAKALPESIVLPNDLEDYMGVSQLTLASRYHDL